MYNVSMTIQKLLISPNILRWARERAGLDLSDLAKSFPKITEWENGQSAPTSRQLDKFAKRVHVPVSYLFLPKPPKEKLPLADFRADNFPSRPSPDLLDTIDDCQWRQDWFRNFSRINGYPSVNIVGKKKTMSSVVAAAKTMRKLLNFPIDEQKECKTWQNMRRVFIQKADNAGVLVMSSGIVKNNTRRILNPNEFRGFALVDEIAPLVFINGKDSKQSQIFTLAHELAHILLGESALSNIGVDPWHENFNNKKEIWCNEVAAEFLIPADELCQDSARNMSVEKEIDLATKCFNVGKLISLRRFLDVKKITRKKFNSLFHDEIEQLNSKNKKELREKQLPQSTAKKRVSNIVPSIMQSRVGTRFARALVEDTLEGKTMYRDAMYMLGTRNTENVDALGKKLGVIQ